MIVSIIICFAGLAALLVLLRRDGLSLGLPLAYLALLMLMHVPGAIAQVFGEQWLLGYEYTDLGMTYTAIGVVCFVVGVGLAHLGPRRKIPPVPADRRTFALYCVVGGWIVVYGLAPLSHVPTLGAAINSGGAIWMLGVLLGLRAATQSGDPRRILAWSGALLVYPVLMLLLGGFLSYGAAAVTIVVAVLAVATRQMWRAVVGMIITGVVGLTIFVNYFDHRTEIRQSVWGGASMEDRVDRVLGMFDDFHLVDLNSEKSLDSLNTRLNQNMFVGLAATRLQMKDVDFLHGETVWDSVIYLIPRVIWANKPVTGGSGDLVARMTGLQLNEDTSWGVGNVLEFYMNFGLPGVVIGFVLLGWALGAIDLRAAIAERRGDLRTTIMYFLPGVGMIQPGGSIMEATGATVAAIAAAYGWRWGWDQWRRRLRERSRNAAMAAAQWRRPDAGQAV